MEKTQSLGRAGVAIPSLSLAAEKNIDGRKSHCAPGADRLVELLQHQVQLQKVDSGVEERKDVRYERKDAGFRLSAALSGQSRDGEDREEERGERNREPELTLVVKRTVPTHVEQQRAEKTQEQQASPRPENY